MMQAIHNFCSSFSKNNFLYSKNTYEKFNVCNDYCIAHHDEKLCFLPNYTYHDILIRDIDELIQKLEAFFFTYQHVDCLYSLFKYRIHSAEKSLPRVDKCLTMCKEQSTLNKETGEWTKCPALQKKYREESTRGIFWALPKGQNQRKQPDQYFQSEVNWSKRLKINWN